MAIIKCKMCGGESNKLAVLLDRGNMALEDGEWAKADGFFEDVLNNDSKNAMAYLGKLMAELKVKKQENLKDCQDPFDNRNNYQKTVRFADAKLKATLKGYIEHINIHNENARIECVYQQAKNALTVAAILRDSSPKHVPNAVE